MVAFFVMVVFIAALIVTMGGFSDLTVTNTLLNYYYNIIVWLYCTVRSYRCCLIVRFAACIEKHIHGNVYVFMMVNFSPI